MAWNREMVTMLRAFIDDWDKSSFSDHRLQQLLVVAASYTIQEIKHLGKTYTINITSPNISPDPTTGTRDGAFINFTVLKAVCIADTSTLRTKALISGIKANAGPARLDTVKHLDGFKTLLEKGPCATYEELKDEHNFSGTSFIEAILSPFVSNSFDPTNSLDNGTFVGELDVYKRNR